MEIRSAFKAPDRAAWRAWLEQNHDKAEEIWLLFDERPAFPTVSYLDAVEEALCFGWIDSIQKRASIHERAQRFSRRRRHSSWSELNKERARRLLRLGWMTDAGRATLPDLSAPFAAADDILAALRADPGAWSFFSACPELYRRLRIAYVEGARRRPVEFERRLHSLVRKSARNQIFGNWNDGGRLGGQGLSEQVAISARLSRTTEATDKDTGT